jgi:iron complex outermembrane recepter protein
MSTHFQVLLRISRSRVSTIWAILILVGHNISAQTLCPLKLYISASNKGSVSGATVYSGLIKTVADSTGIVQLTQHKCGATVLIACSGYQSKRVSIASDSTILHIRLTPLVLELAPFEVRATRIQPGMGMASVTLDKAALSRSVSGQDMPYLLQNTPSVVASSDAGTGIGYTALRVRGSDPTRTSVALNGVPVNDAESQGTFWVNLPDLAGSTQSIQVQRGVGTTIAGPGAFGAGVNIATLPPSDTASILLEAAGGSWGTGRAALQLGSGRSRKGFAFQARVSALHSDGWVNRASARLVSYSLQASWRGKKTNYYISVGRNVPTRPGTVYRKIH